MQRCKLTNTLLSNATSNYIYTYTFGFSTHNHSHAHILPLPVDHPGWFHYADLRLLRTLQIALFQHFSLTSPIVLAGIRRNLPSKMKKISDYARIILPKTKTTGKEKYREITMLCMVLSCSVAPQNHQTSPKTSQFPTKGQGCLANGLYGSLAPTELGFTSPLPMAYQKDYLPEVYFGLMFLWHYVNIYIYISL